MIPKRQSPRSSTPDERADSGPSTAAYHRGVVIVILVLVVLALGVVLAAVVSRAGVPGVEDAVSTQSFAGLGTGPVHAQDVRGIRLDVAFRGYRMDQVDAVIDRLRDELAVRDDEIDRLRAQEEPRGDL